MRRNDGRVVSNFINQALDGKDLTVYGDGKQTRSFCYVTDLVDGIVKMMFTDKAKGNVVNLGNPDEYRVIDLAKKIKLLTGSGSHIAYGKLPQDDPTIRQPDITKAQKLLGWNPKIDLDKGLRDTIAYYRNIR
jgi:nucleoside-diphosphate-sugar epimerase